MSRSRSLRSRWVVGLAAIAASSLITVGEPAGAQPMAGGAPPPPAQAAPSGAGAVGGPGSAMNVDPKTLFVNAKSGAWADYVMSGKGGDKPITVRYAVVERTPAKLSFEIDTPTPKGDMIMHFEFAPKGADAWKLTGGKIQMGEQKMDMPGPQLATAPPVKLSDPPGDLVGTETITTPAGTFPCKHYKKSMAMGNDAKGPVLDMWINDKVSPTGIVKSKFDAMGVEMNLAGTGTGAQSKLK